jgi:hypothetical protein
MPPRPLLRLAHEICQRTGAAEAAELQAVAGTGPATPEDLTIGTEVTGGEPIVSASGITR